MGGSVHPEVQDNLVCLHDVELEVIRVTFLYKLSDAVPVLVLNVSSDQAYESGIICIFDVKCMRFIIPVVICMYSEQQ